ncbi:MAG TPA: hypothetical protein VF158_13750 [Longimicrobiales bacterium]
MPTVLLCVTGMTGADDEARLEDALRAEPGVLGAVASHRDGCAEVDIDDDRITYQRLIEVIAAAGFQAELAG